MSLGLPIWPMSRPVCGPVTSTTSVNTPITPRTPNESLPPCAEVTRYSRSHDSLLPFCWASSACMVDIATSTVEMNTPPVARDAGATATTRLWLVPSSNESARRVCAGVCVSAEEEMNIPGLRTCWVTNLPACASLPKSPEASGSKSAGVRGTSRWKFTHSLAGAAAAVTVPVVVGQVPDVAAGLSSATQEKKAIPEAPSARDTRAIGRTSRRIMRCLQQASGRRRTMKASAPTSHAPRAA